MEFVKNPTLNSISADVDALWSTRLTSIRESNKALQPLIYAANKLLAKMGRPNPGDVTFSSWLDERKIPQRTGYDILKRERVRLGEIICESADFQASTDTGELDVDAQEATTEAHSSPVAASAPSADAIASPPARTPYKALTPAELKTRRAELEKLLREQVGETQAQRIIDQAVVDHLTMALNVKANKKALKKDHSGLIARLNSGNGWQEAA